MAGGKDATPAILFFCGLGSGFMEAIFAITPMETIKVKIINDQRSKTPRYNGLMDALTKIMQEDGLRGIYRGVLPTMMIQGSNQAIRFYVVESLKAVYRERKGTFYVPQYMVGLFGSFAGIISVALNTPIDTIKTRMQGLDAKKKYKNAWDCAMKLINEEGVRGLYKGTIPRLMHVCVCVSFTFMIYDAIQELFDIYWPVE